MKKIRSILLLGSGALKIGEAGEFDYSGSQAIKAMKEEGIKVILVNPNVATVQTSAGFADQVYFLPVTSYFVEKIIAKEKPDGIFLSFGGQTALNCGLELAKQNILEKYQVKVLGTPISAIDTTEDRQLFTKHLAAINLKTAQGKIVKSLKEGLDFAQKIGYPLMLRAGFALGGTGSGIANSKKELETLLTNALATTSQVIVEESLWGWKEVEYEVVRDGFDNCITVCNMENFDPVGIHTGESIVVAPSQTLNDRQYFALRQAAIDTIRSLKIVGECNIQFALDPKSDELRVIEVNARLSRSSALASKATGYPLAYVSAKLALGKSLAEIPNSVTKTTTAFFEPALDYITVKMPRWDLDKFSKSQQSIGSEMKSVGEVMAIGRSFEEAIQKAVRMLNIGFDGVIDHQLVELYKAKKLNGIDQPDPSRIFKLIAALITGESVTKLSQKTGIDLWFLEKLQAIAGIYHELESAKALTKDLLKRAKQAGFSDIDIAKLCQTSSQKIRQKRLAVGIAPMVKQIDTMAGEFPSQTNYLYLTYHGEISDRKPNHKQKKVIVLGCGPYAIGTSVEFDWCGVEAVNGIRRHGQQAIIINCNPETVSTDYDMSDFLYFEELSLERVCDICDLEQSPVIVSVGGQIANNLAPKLEKANIPILGTKAETIVKAESRDEFSNLLDSLGIAQPAWNRVASKQELQDFVAMYGYPVLVRPSFVLSGKAMSVLESDEVTQTYIDNLTIDIKEYPLVVSQFLLGAKECDFDGIAQNGQIIEYALSEHVEYGGVHSGDASLVLPASGISPDITQKITGSAGQIIKALKLNGPFNIQFLVKDDIAYVIECNARSSRSFPYVSKASNANFIETMIDSYLGKSPHPKHYDTLPYKVVKVPQFSFNKLRGTDPVPTVEMNSTGEVVGFGQDIYEAYLSAILSTGMSYPSRKAVFISLGGASGKLAFLHSCKLLQDQGFTIYATAGTSFFLRESGVEVTTVGKIYEGTHPNVIDLLQKDRIDFAVVIPEHAQEAKHSRVLKGQSDGYAMRRLAIDLGVPLFTNAQNARLFIEAISMYQPEDIAIKSWQDYTNLLQDSEYPDVYVEG
ncbi:carbamoyl-phosphate synthase (glutamine-hydrolyzing) large subunit [Candidatus Beckwithbacteria bacterium]|nr:carbamoyl-phosphate synthase (glutamine-hydrolyzing) large subunit [Candidatus Beckwithbacteria bacterium]